VGKGVSDYIDGYTDDDIIKEIQMMIGGIGAHEFHCGNGFDLF